MVTRTQPIRIAAKQKPSLRRFFKKRIYELVGLGLIISSVFLAVSLLSFNRADPSLNKTTSEAVQNWGGVAGAYAADLLLQIVGLASFIVVLCATSWGWRCVSKSHVRGWWLRISALFVALTIGAVFFSALVPESGWPVATGWGGSIGLMLSTPLIPLLSQAGLIAAAGLLSLIVIPAALGLRRQEWLVLWLITATFATLATRRIVKAIRRLRGSFDEESIDEDMPERNRQPEARRVPKLQVKKIVSREVEEEDAPIRVTQPRQASFDLDVYDGEFELPSTTLLAKVPAKSKKKKISDSSLSQNAELLEKTLDDFGVKGEIIRVRPGPVVTLYELEPAAGTKSSRVIGLADDIARSMSAAAARIAVIPGKNAMGIELPNSQRETVYLREMFEHLSYQQSDTKLPLVLGKDIGGEPVIADLARMPHLLVAGTTGSGKSVAINTMIMSLIFRLSPDECRFIMIDPKMLELSVYDDIPHLLAPVVTEPGKAVVALKWTVKEMENRYRLMSNLGVRNIENYNKRIREAAQRGEELFRTVQTGFDPETGRPVMEKVAIDMNPLPFIVVVVDEMADLMLVAGKDIETSIQRLAQMARAAGIHIIMATQRPSVDVITGVIKANFPTRISFQVTSKIDSRTILGEQGAEQLLGQGDMLYMAGGGRIQRVHGPFISDKEVEQIVSFLKTQGAPSYVEDVTIDDSAEEFGMGETGEDGDSDRALYDQAVAIVLRDQKASTSYIQRKLKIGYNRAARIIEQMEEEGVVGGANHVGKREVLMRHAG